MNDGSARGSPVQEFRTAAKTSCLDHNSLRKTIYLPGQLWPTELAIAAASIYLAALCVFVFDDDRAAWAILTRSFAAPFRAASPSR